LVIKVSGGADRAREEAAERVVYKDLSQHAKSQDGVYGRREAIREFLVRTAREGGVDGAMSPDKLEEFIEKFVKYA
jgi:hypothetical protein